MAGELEGNGLWESSRWMLPEHGDFINVFNKELERKPRKELTDDELEQISRELQQSMKYHVQICIRMYDPFEDLCVIGVVENINKQHGQFKVGDDWFLVQDIVSVQQDDAIW